MLSIARSCINPLRTNFVSCSWQQTQKLLLFSPTRQIFYKPTIQTTLRTNKLQNAFRQSGTIAVSFASKANVKSEKLVGSWLLICSGMVFVAVVLGGVTRLTESGLSMVTWKLLGENMPLSEERWVEEFDRYKQFPEYKINNRNMTLSEFKKIWWMEYAHRTWGRLIGVTFAVPAALFWAKGMLKPGMKPRILVLGSLIGAQGLLGWYMVKSGLEDRFHEPSDVPRVSQYRLASHLGMALVLFTSLLYNTLDHLSPARKIAVDYFGSHKIDLEIFKKFQKFKMLVYSTKGLVFITALSGALVAGMDAGLIYNSFPKMGNQWVPDEIFALTPMWRNFLENPATVQFDHRVLGIATVSLVTGLAMIARKCKLPGKGNLAANVVLCAGYLQVLLGISTLLHFVPVTLAAMHQSGSLVLLSSMVWLCHEIKYLKRLPK